MLLRGGLGEALGAYRLHGLADDVADGGSVDREPSLPVAPASDPCPDGIPVAVLPVCDDDGILRPVDGKDIFRNRHEDPLFYIV